MSGGGAGVSLTKSCQFNNLCQCVSFNNDVNSLVNLTSDDDDDLIGCVQPCHTPRTPPEEERRQGP